MTDHSPNPVAGHTETDLGLKNFMLGTYRYMAMAMGVTAVVAYMFSQLMMTNPSIAAFVYNPLVLLGFVIAIPVLFGSIGARLHKMSMGGMMTFLFGFAAFMGVFMSAVALRYDPMVIAKIFFMTVAMFGALSMFGYSTGRDLSTFAKYAFAAFLGYVAINVLGMFWPAIRPTGTLDLIITGVALLAISVITAWETQMLKRVYYSMAGNAAMLGKMSAYGAASLLLAFINMFQILLSLFGRE